MTGIANVAQSVEHFHGKEKVTSSILVIGSRIICATLAQLVEHLTRNEKVRSSILRGGSLIGDRSVRQLLGVRAESNVGACFV